MSETTVIAAASSNPHQEAIDILSKQLVWWYKQIQELTDAEPDRAKNLRYRCKNVRNSINTLQAQETI